MSLPVRVLSCEVSGDFHDPAAVWHHFLVIANRLPEVTILAAQHHIFPGGGLSGAIIIGESHLAIHTWPEHQRAYVLLASCSSIESLAYFKREVSQVWTVVGEDTAAPT